MERVTPDNFGRSSLRYEHVHRYILASRVARGTIVDCACGIGYGSEILSRQPAVEMYIGVDPSHEALTAAKTYYAAPHVDFRSGTLESLPCLYGSVDTFVMFETLEHTVDPARSIANVRQHIAADGLLIGSVPSADYESMCERTYGPNPYHLQRFTPEKLVELLGAHFEVVRLLSVEFVLGTLVRDLESDSNASNGKIVNGDESVIAGSLLFVAGEEKRVATALKDLDGVPQFIVGMPKVVLDAEEVEPIRVAFHKAEVQIDERDKAISAQGRMLKERWLIMQSMGGQIGERDQINQALCNVTLSSLRMRGHESIFKELTSFNGGGTPFIDMAFSLYLFIFRLYHALRAKGVQDLFFFAREGQPLKQMFDFYQTFQVGEEVIRTHYLKVSRRSTFLISLGRLDEEDFSVLFRQYRRISILDFLKSLDLHEYAESLASALGIDLTTLGVISNDLPTDPGFLKLRQLELFRQIYENQRIARGIAFESYLKGFFESGTLPDELHAVDVGWKGSIQDNLYHWFRRAHGENAQVHGYYLGLVATGAIAAKNRKMGLLFSNIEGRTPGFHVFNENRSLFEIILHADHGSACRYAIDAQGNPAVIEDEFHESAMISNNVHAVSRPIMDLFRQIVAVMACEPLPDLKLLGMTLDRHYRMVFDPSKKEVEWVFSVSHVENFGVFEESGFGNFEGSSDLLSKLRFTWHLVRMNRPLELGNWPWLTIRKRALPGLSLIYSLFRRWQSR